MDNPREVDLLYFFTGSGLAIFIALIVIVFICGHRNKRKLTRNEEKMPFFGSLDIATVFSDMSENRTPRNRQNDVSQSDSSTSHVHTTLASFGRFPLPQRMMVSSDVFETNIDSASLISDSMDLVKQDSEHGEHAEKCFASYMSLDDIIPKLKCTRQDTDCLRQQFTTNMKPKSSQVINNPLPLPPRHPKFTNREGAMMTLFCEKKESMPETQAMLFNHEHCCNDVHLRYPKKKCQCLVCSHQQPTNRHRIHRSPQLLTPRPRSVSRLGTNCKRLIERNSSHDECIIHNWAKEARFAMCVDHPTSYQGGGYFIPSTGESLTDLQFYPVERHSMINTRNNLELLSLETPGTQVYQSNTSILGPLLAEHTDVLPILERFSSGSDHKRMCKIAKTSCPQKERRETPMSYFQDNISKEQPNTPFPTSWNEDTVDFNNQNQHTEDELHSSTSKDSQKYNYLTVLEDGRQDPGASRNPHACIHGVTAPLAVREDSRSIMLHFKGDDGHQETRDVLKNVQSTISEMNSKLKVFSVPRGRTYSVHLEKA